MARAPALLLCLLWSLPASAANPYLEKARKLVTELRFAEAIPVLEVARHVPSAAASEREEALLLLARCEVAEGRPAAAEKDFTELLGARPLLQLPVGESPKIREVFLRAKRALYPPGYCVLERVAAPPGFVQVTLTDPWRAVLEVRAFTRVESEGHWHEQDLLPALSRGSAQLALPALPPGARAEWYVEAQGAHGVVLAHLGSALVPNEVRAELPPNAVSLNAPAPGWRTARHATGWTLVGLAAVGLGTGLVFELRERQHDQASQAASASAAQALSYHRQALGDAQWGVRGLAIGGGLALAGTALLVW